VALEQRFGPRAASARFAMLLGPRFDGTLRGSAPAAFGPGRRLLVTSAGAHNHPPASNPREHIWIATQLSADVTSTADALGAADVLLPNLATLLELGNTSGSARREQPFAAGVRQQPTGDAPAAPTEPTRESPAPLRMPKGLPVDAVRSLHLTLDATSPFAQRISATPVMTWNVHADSGGERWLVATIGDGQTAPDGPTPPAATPQASGLASDDLAGRRIVDLAVRFVEDGGGDGYAPNFSPHSTQARLALGPLQGGLGPVSRIGRWLTWHVDAQADGSVRGRGTLGLRAMAMPGAAGDVHNASPAGK